MGAKVTRGMILVVGIHPPAVGQISMQVTLGRTQVLPIPTGERTAAGAVENGAPRLFEAYAGRGLDSSHTMQSLAFSPAVSFWARPVPRLAVALCMVAGGSGTGVEDDSNSSHTAHICGSYCGYTVGTTCPARA